MGKKQYVAIQSQNKSTSSSSLQKSTTPTQTPKKENIIEIKKKKMK